jgi:hypothetical protein
LLLLDEAGEALPKARKISFSKHYDADLLAFAVSTHC